MADIFLSYSEKDRDTARQLAEALLAAGWTVWWDRRIPAGHTWRGVLERELQAMRCMVVLWSSNSVHSEWVCEEAAEGRQLGRLVPVAIDRVRPPAGFRELQAADLVGWDGARDAAGLRQLFDDLGQRIGPPGAAPPAGHGGPDGLQAVPAPPPPRWADSHRPWWPRGAMLLAGVAMLAAVGTFLVRTPPPADARAARPAASSPPLPDPARQAAPAPVASAPTAADAQTPKAPQPVVAGRPGPPAHTAPPTQARASARCAALLERLALGETLSEASQTVLRQECPP